VKWFMSLWLTECSCSISPYHSRPSSLWSTGWLSLVPKQT